MKSSALMKVKHFKFEVGVNSLQEAIKISNILQDYDKECQIVKVEDELYCKDTDGEWYVWKHPLTGEKFSKYVKRYNFVSNGQTEVEKEILNYLFDGKVREMYEGISYMHNCSHSDIVKIVDKFCSRGIIE